MKNIDLANEIAAGEIKVTKIGNQSKKGLIATLGVAAALAIGAGAVYVTHTNSIPNPTLSTTSEAQPTNTTVINHPGVLDSIKNKIENATPKLNNEYKISGNLIADDTKIRLQQAMNFDLPKNLADNQIAHYIAQDQFKKGNYDLAILAYAEGFSKKAYNDVGTAAIGFGTNVGRQSVGFATQLISSVSQNHDTISNFKASANKSWDQSVGSASKLNLDAKSSLEMAAIHLDTFKTQFIQVLAHQMEKNPQAIAMHKSTGKSYNDLAQDTFNKFSLNEQTAFAYHTYKVGAGGAAKYGIMLNNAIAYGLSDHTESLKEKVTPTFEYNYKLNGQTVVDQAAATKLQALWEGKDVLGAFLGQNMPPPDFKTRVPALNKYKIDVPQNGQEITIPDPFKDAKVKATLEGKTFDPELVTPNTNIANMRQTQKPAHGYALPGSF